MKWSKRRQILPTNFCHTLFLLKYVICTVILGSQQATSGRVKLHAVTYLHQPGMYYHKLVLL